jgi:hypothetical protein
MLLLKLLTARILDGRPTPVCSRRLTKAMMYSFARTKMYKSRLKLRSLVRTLKVLEVLSKRYRNMLKNTKKLVISLNRYCQKVSITRILMAIISLVKSRTKVLVGLAMSYHTSPLQSQDLESNTAKSSPCLLNKYFNATIWLKDVPEVGLFSMATLVSNPILLLINASHMSLKPRVKLAVWLKTVLH